MTSALPRGGAPTGDSEFHLGADEFRRIAEMLHGDAGIRLPKTKQALVYSRLIKRLRALGLTSFRAYCDHVSGSDGLDERRQMLVALTTNVTSFFRESHHFDHLRTVTLPPLLEACRRGGRVRLWSAGCSRGHEPYSMAMTVLSLMPDVANFDLRILATDIDTRVLDEAVAGDYDDDAVARISRADRLRFFIANMRDGVRTNSVGPDLRALVSFRELNLIASWPMRRMFDVIFCRNVLIYFDNETQNRIWSRFSDVLQPQGHLYIGHSERIGSEANAHFTSVGLTTYRRTTAGLS